MNYEFSTDWHSMHEAEWREYLAIYAGRPDISALEIGSYEGRSACWLLENILTHDSAKLICIDTFRASPLERFDANIKKSGCEKKVLRYASESFELLRIMNSKTFDIIYIDGSHDSRDVIADLVLSWALLTDGGTMIMDDYEIAEGQSPKKAIDAFLEIFKEDLSILHKGYQVIIRRNQ
jgi:predicted O-methyltransferase YrrM